MITHVLLVSKITKKILLFSSVALFACFQLQPAWGQVIQAREKYEKKYLFDFKFHKETENPACFYIDDSSLVYVLHYRDPYVEVFNNKGKPIRSFKCTWKGGDSNVNYRLLIDERGNMLVYTPWTINANNFVLDKDGNLLKTFFCGVNWPWEIGFENGVIYSKGEGKILDAVDENQKEVRPRQFFKDIDDLYGPHEFQEPRPGIKIKKHTRQTKLPKFLQLIGEDTYKEIDRIKEDSGYGIYGEPPPGIEKKFRYEDIIDIDDKGNIYAKYGTPPVFPNGKFGKILRTFKVFIFDSDFQLLAVLNTENIGYPNFPAASLYDLSPGSESGDFKVYKWEKIR